MSTMACFSISLIGPNRCTLSSCAFPSQVNHMMLLCIYISNPSPLRFRQITSFSHISQYIMVTSEDQNKHDFVHWMKKLERSWELRQYEHIDEPLYLPTNDSEWHLSGWEAMVPTHHIWAQTLHQLFLALPKFSRTPIQPQKDLYAVQVRRAFYP